ncbi:MAG: GMC family oxidoreductase, partial [Bryobacterales bacterium]|nr:GMC family oxidoreductase [Bryobacterales bacterium]
MPEIYDVVIVGAGVTGAIIAKRLVAERKRVLILEAGRGFHLEGEAAYHDYQKFLERFYANPIKVPNSPYPPNPNAKSQDCVQAGSPYWKDPASGYFVQTGKLPFLSDYFRGQGGTTLHWNGTALRMLPNDFKLSSKYGQGVDWPISYEDLRPYYEQAETEIGVSGNAVEQILPNMGDNYFGHDYDLPMEKMPQSYIDQELIRTVNGLPVQDAGETYNLSLISTPMSRNSIPRKNPRTNKYYQPAGSLWDAAVGVRCEGNSNCVPICPVQAKYNALKTLAAAVRDHRERLTIQAQSVASKIEIDPATGRVTGIAYKRYNDPNSPEHTVHTARAKIYVIAAHSVETAKLLLASGAAKTSDQVGRNLMDHSCMLVWGLMPQPVGAFRGPASTSNLCTFRDGDFRSKHAAFIAPVNNWGWSWATFAPGSTLNDMLNPGAPAKAWKPAQPIIGRKLRGQL